jgi:phosphomannomutase
MTRFIFDVDGTLTPSRQKINKDFDSWFLDFASKNRVWLVTGSDYEKTLEQLGDDICGAVNLIYNCSGNDIWSNGKRRKYKAFIKPDGLDDLLNSELDKSSFEIRAGNHIEERMGTINFSIVGRDADIQQRKKYIEFDTKTNEREKRANTLVRYFPDVMATVGGETGIDIYNKGADKQQILTDFNSTDKLLFFGDKTEPGGNDYTLARELNSDKYPKSKAIQVKNWRETWSLLVDIVMKDNL